MLRTVNYGDFAAPTPSEPDFEDRVGDLVRYDIVVAGTHYLAGMNNWRYPFQHIIKILKSKNPNLRTFRYYISQYKQTFDRDWGLTKLSEVAYYQRQSPLLWKDIEANDWWLYDSGNDKVEEIRPDGQGHFLIDVGKDGVKEAFLAGILDYPIAGYDGICLDALEIPFRHIRLDRNYRDYAHSQDWWERAWKPFIEHICPALRNAGFLLMGNYPGFYNLPKDGATTFGMEDHQRSYLDIAGQESCFFGWNGEWLTDNAWRVKDEVARRIESLRNDPLAVVCNDILTQDLTDSKIDCTLAAYYVSLPDSPTKRYHHYVKNKRPFWDVRWALDIGEIIPNRPPVKSPSVLSWERQFTDGLVLLNYDPDETMNYKLRGKRVKDCAGHIYSGKIALPPQTGLVLQNSLRRRL